MIIVDGTALRDAHRNRIARRERLLDRTIELLVQVRLRVLWKSLVSSGHDLTPVRTSEEVGHGRAAQLLNPTPGRKVNGPLLHSFQVAPDAPPLTHPENRYRAFVFSALVRSYLRPHRSSEERSPPRAANVCAISFACSSSGTRRMTSTRLSAIRAARLAASAPPAAIRSSTMSPIAQCRHSSASSSSGVGRLPSGVALISAGRFFGMPRSFAEVLASMADHGPIDLLPRSEAPLDMTR